MALPFSVSRPRLYDDFPVFSPPADSPSFSSSLPHFLPFLTLLYQPSLALSSQSWSIGKVPLQSSMSSVRGSIFNPFFACVFFNFFLSPVISLSLAGAFIKLVHVIDGIYLCVCFIATILFIVLKAYGIKPMLVGSSYAISASK